MPKPPPITGLRRSKAPTGKLAGLGGNVGRFPIRLQVPAFRVGLSLLGGPDVIGGNFYLVLGFGRLEMEVLK